MSNHSINQVRHLKDDDTPSEKVETIECANSQEALQKAWTLIDGHGVEVWCEHRLVGRLEPPSH